MSLDNAEESELAPSLPILLFSRFKCRELIFMSLSNADERDLAPY